MPRGKAVGAGGLSMEMLLAAGVDTQRAFYRAMMSDLRGKRVPSEWKTVLYALLVKPAPNDPEVVAQRREIALMPQDMKLLLQMVRRASYQRIVGRVLWRPRQLYRAPAVGFIRRQRRKTWGQSSRS